MIYADYNATAPLRPAAREALVAALDAYGNPSSIHAAGRAARLQVEEARMHIATAAQCDSSEVIFTSGGTEANALALGCVDAPKMFISAGEHDSIRQNAAEAQISPLTADGVIDLDAAEEALKHAPPRSLVSVHWVNNETGVIQPIPALFDLTQRYGALLHVDAVQAFGRIPLDVPVDLLSLSAHKIGGAMGAGALIVRRGLKIAPLIKGGGQERGRRSGTENVPALAAFGAAAIAAAKDLPAFQKLAIYRDAFEAIIQTIPQVRIMGAAAPRVANTSCFICPPMKANLTLMQLDLADICASSGSACASGKVTASHVLKAMGVDDAGLQSALRFSFGWQSDEKGIKKAAETWTSLAKSAIK